jgi:curved DNA-binding protein
MRYKDYYTTMGVARDAPQEEIRRAYRKLARKFHPDVSKEPDAEERFKELGEAYEVLKDPAKRAAYDRLGSGWKPGEEFRPPPDWDAGGVEFESVFGQESAFSDFFESLFGGGRRRPGGRTRSAGAGFRQAARGQNQHATIEVSLEDAYRGSTRSLQLSVPEPDASGRTRLATRTLNVRIPPGVTAGQQIRLAGQGTPGLGGAPSGDLYLEVALQPHALFTVEGRDILANVPVAPWEAALGATVPIPTLGGTVEMKIPPGSQSGRRLRLRGRGLPGRPPGDQYVTLQILTPPATTDEVRDLYRRLAQASGFDPRAGIKV